MMLTENLWEPRQKLEASEISCNWIDEEVGQPTTEHILRVVRGGGLLAYLYTLLCLSGGLCCAAFVVGQQMTIEFMPGECDRRTYRHRIYIPQHFKIILYVFI